MSSPNAPVTDFWHGRRVFVTGASGIVGSWLTKELIRQGAHVTILIRDADPRSELSLSGDSQRVSVVNGSLEDFLTLERAVNEHEIDTVFHLGAKTIVGAAHRFPLATFESNVRGTYNLMEACRVHAGLVQRVVVASSDKAYGDFGGMAYEEDMALNGQNIYDVSKVCVDVIARAYSHTHAVPVAVIRSGNIYGGGDLNWSRIVPGTIRHLLRGERPILRSDGTFVRDYLYVKDVVQAYLRTAERLQDEGVKGQAFNISDESPMSVIDIVRAIQLQMDATHIEPLVLNEIQGEIPSQHLSSAKAHSVLDWRPKFSLEAGMSETIEWYSKFLG